VKVHHRLHNKTVPHVSLDNSKERYDHILTYKHRALSENIYVLKFDWLCYYVLQWYWL